MSNPHRIEVTIDRDGYITGRMICDAPHGADCRLWCVHDCTETTDEHLHEHHLEDQGRCIQTDGWFDEIFDAYSGDQAPLHSGPVNLHWHGDFYTWTYATEPTEHAEHAALAAEEPE